MTTNSDMPTVEADWSTLQEAIERVVLLSIQHSVPSARKEELTFSLYNGKSSNIEIVISVSAGLDDQTVARFNEILSNDEPDLLQFPEYGPSLYIAKGYILLHKGQLLFSRGKQSGFHFAIKLPVYQG